MDIIRIRIRTGYVGGGQATRVNGYPGYDENQPHVLTVTINPDMVDEANINKVMNEVINEMAEVVKFRLKQEVEE